MRARRLTGVLTPVVLLTLVLMLAGCSESATASLPLSGPSEALPLGTPTPPPPGPTVPPGQPPPAIACFGIPETTCNELVRSAADDLGVATFQAIRITCTSAASCTVRSGTTQVEVVLLDGRRVSYDSSWHTAGDPEPLPIPSLGFRPVCVGLDRNHCSARILEVVMTTADDAGITGLDIRCVGRCTPDGGQGRTVVTFVGGRTTTTEWTYGPSG